MSDLFQKSQAYISCQLQQRHDHIKEERRAGPSFVTISRQTGAYGLTLAEKLAEHLEKHDRRAHCPWTAFDKDLIQKVIEEHNLPESSLPYLSETVISEIQDTMEELFGLHPSKWTLVHRMSETILHLAEFGYVVLVGRGANFITRKLPNGVHVRLIGPIEKRIRHIQEYYLLTEKEAKEYIAREEHDRKNYIRKYFEKDANDPSHYDLVVNMDAVSVETAVEMIAHSVLKKESVEGKADAKTIHSYSER